MKNSRKYIYIGIILVVAVITVTTTLVLAFSKSGNPFTRTKTDSTKMKPVDPTESYNQIVKPEDKSPISVSQENIKNGKAIHVPVLMYHHIGTAPATADATHKGLTVSSEEFEKQIKYLKDNGYESVSMNGLYNKIKNEVYKWPKKPVIITFDDGYTDVFENAIPILNKYGYTGTFGIITEFPGQTQGDNFYASWDQIQSAQKEGMEIVCHSQNHFDGSNPKFTSDYIYQNLSGCQKDLIAHLGEAEPYLIYPYGHFTPAYVSQALKSGFVMAFTVHEGSYINTEDLMHIPRVRVNPNQTMEKFIEKLNS